MGRFVLALAFALVLLPLQAAPRSTTPASYRLGIFPYMAPRQTVEFYGPVAASMKTALNHPVRLESVQTFTDFSRALERQAYDIALIQPFDYPKVVEEYGYLPLAQFAVPLVAQFYVRNDSRYHNLEDLRGTTIAMPPEPSANSRMAMRALLDNNLIPGQDVKVHFFKSHDSCLQQVWAGTASACCTARPPIIIFEKRMQAKLRSIYDSAPIPHVLFVVNPRVPIADRTRLQKLITGWSKTEKGRKMLKNLGFPGFVLPKPAEYAVMRNFNEVAATKEKPVPVNNKELVLGVFPFLAARQLAHNFAPVLPALRQAVGKNVHLRTATNFESFSGAIEAIAYDIVLVQPFDYATAASHGYLPLAAMKEPAQGTFFVLKNSSYKKISDFRGHRIAMPPYNAAQSYLGRRALRQAGLQPGRDVIINYRKTHDSCLRQVQQGLAAACITSKMVLPMIPASISRNLRSVGITETVPGVVFMAHKRLSVKVREQLQAEILSWNHNVSGQKILHSIGLGEFEPFKLSRYQNLSKFD